MSRGLTYEEAAAELGIGLETVKEHLKRARGRSTR
jgi:DNA-directed RNA polymerase specialized sigma24 family protein